MDSRVMQRWLLAAASSALVAALGITQASAQVNLPTSLAQGPTVAVESQAGTNPSVSSDGRFVVYAGPPATEGDERTSTVWLRDRSNGGEVELTQPLPGAKIGNSTMPVISGDACYAAVLTEMPFDLFRDDDTGDRWDVYRLKLPNCGGDLHSWELISTNAFRGDDAVAADDIDPQYPPTISGSGSVIAYTHKFDSAQPDLDGVIVVDLTKPAGQPGHALPVAGTPVAAPDCASHPCRTTVNLLPSRPTPTLRRPRRTGARARSPATSPARRSMCGTASALIQTPRSNEPRSAPTAPPTATRRRPPSRLTAPTSRSAPQQ